MGDVFSKYTYKNVLPCNLFFADLKSQLKKWKHLLVDYLKSMQSIVNKTAKSNWKTKDNLIIMQTL